MRFLSSSICFLPFWVVIKKCAPCCLMEPTGKIVEIALIALATCVRGSCKASILFLSKAICNSSSCQPLMSISLKSLMELRSLLSLSATFKSLFLSLLVAIAISTNGKLFLRIVAVGSTISGGRSFFIFAILSLTSLSTMRLSAPSLISEMIVNLPFLTIDSMSLRFCTFLSSSSRFCTTISSSVWALAPA